MLTLATKLKTITFVVLAIVVLAYVGIKYADIGRYFGAPGYYTVKLELVRAGGIYTNAEIDYRGVPVGRVGPLDLTDDGVVAELHINNSAPRIPGDVQAVVADRSVVGEQFVDLRPRRDTGPYLAAGSRIARTDSQVPQPVTALLTSVNGFAASVPKEPLRTVVNELNSAFSGQGQNLQSLIDNTSSFTNAAYNDLPHTVKLINDGATVLRTQEAESSDLTSFSRDLRKFSRQLASSDPDLRRLITAAPTAASQVSALLRDNDPSLSVVFANLLTLSNLTVTRQNGLQETLVGLPAVTAAGATAVNSGGANFGMALTFFNPQPCMSGYEATPYRNGLKTTPSPPLNTSARCTLPSSSGVEVRGSAHAPKGGVPNPATAHSMGLEAAPNAALPAALGIPPLADTPKTTSELLGLGAR
jgi:phospholipid/cholesterol/gamma-HCH transport system substrate-binding protein